MSGNVGEDLVVKTALIWLQHDKKERLDSFITHILPNIILKRTTKEMMERLQTCLDSTQEEGSIYFQLNTFNYIFNYLSDISSIVFN